MSKPFRHVEMNRPRRSVFDLSHYKLFTTDMGHLVPVLVKNMVPGDHFKISNEIVLRVNPMVAPIMHEINVYTHYFFCPLRPMWPKPRLNETDPVEPGSWEDFFTGGKDGTLKPAKPKWDPDITITPWVWDYMGFPIDINGHAVKPAPGSYRVDAFPLRAYNWVYNLYYRDKNYQDEVDLDDQNLKWRCWEKDYFTTALPWTQRGTAPALPISGLTNAEFLGLISANTGMTPPTSTSYFYNDSVSSPPQTVFRNYFSSTDPDNPPSSNQILSWFNNNQVDLSNAATFDVNDLRLAFQTQKFLERNARAGTEYKDQLMAHYGVYPRDDRLQRPEYIGGTRSPIIVSEVLQTSSTDSNTPQGNLAGHGMSVSRQFGASYYAKEFGIVIGIMSIMPRPVYQQGIDREFLGETRYDLLLPEFVSLGEQPVYNMEIMASWTDKDFNNGTFGFNGRFDEYRTARNMVCTRMRNGVPNSLGFWHVARYFANNVALNEDFVSTYNKTESKSNVRNDFLAVPSEPAFVVTYGNIIRAVRPLPAVGTPGLIDHH